ncbi:MAG: restriction endonuclease subunit S [Hyphomonas sp.]
MSKTSARGHEPWPIRRLFDLCYFIPGKAHEPFIDPLGDYICVNSKFISTEGQVAKACNQNITPARKGDVLMVMSDLPNGRALAKCFLVGEDDKYAVNQRVCILRPKAGNDPRLLFHILNRNRYFLSFDDGVNQTHLLNPTFQKCEISVPDTLNEQRAIAAALSDADGVVAELERVIAKKRLIKQGAMQDLLTARRRLPGFLGEWDVKKLGTFCRLEMGGTPSRLNDSYWGKGHPWLTIADLQSKIISSSKEQVTDQGAALLTPVKAGTLMMSFKLSIGRMAFAGCELFTNEAICSFNDLTEDAEFLFYALSRTDFALYGKQAVKGYTLNKQSLKEVEVFLPRKEEQQAIAAVLSDMDAEIQTLESRLTKARAVKEGTMQNLLTGRVRLV